VANEQLRPPSAKLPKIPTFKEVQQCWEDGAIFAPMVFSLRWLWIVLAAIVLAVIGFGIWVLVVAHTFRNGI